MARRVLEMGAAETTERIGPYQFKATTHFKWSAGSKTVELSETRSLIAGPGGVAGDFHGQIDNSEDQGLEVIRVGGNVYARNRYGKFRQRQRDRGMAEREREEIFAALHSYDALFFGRLALTPLGACPDPPPTSSRRAALPICRHPGSRPESQLGRDSQASLASPKERSGSGHRPPQRFLGAAAAQVREG